MLGLVKTLYATLLRAQVRKPLRLIIAAAVLTGLSAPLALQLELNSSWRALLPDRKVSVRDLDKIGDRIGGMSTLSVVLQSDDLGAMQRFAAKLVPRLEQALAGQILRIDWNMEEYRKFVEEHRHLYVELDHLKELRDGLQSRLDYERLKNNPLFIDLSEEMPPSVDELIKEVTDTTNDRAAVFDAYPGGYYVHPDRNLLVIFIRTDFEGGDATAATSLIDATRRTVAALEPHTYAPDLQVDLAADLPEALEEHRAITEELIIATTATIVLVLAAIFVFFLRWRAIPILGAALIPPVTLTFAFAELTVDYLNTSTAFLGSIVIGNGVNPNIIWLARYFEERRKGKGIVSALVATQRNVWAATLTASLAAGLAYGSLVITDFRGFRDFGIIGGVGMIVCWIGSMTILPALVSFSEKWAPIVSEKRSTRRAPYGLLFAALVQRIPRVIVITSLVLGVASGIIVAVAIANDPLEYDISKLRSVTAKRTHTEAINDRINEFITRTASGTVVILLAPTADDVEHLQTSLEKRRDRGQAVYGEVRSIRNLLPMDQQQKRSVLRDIRRLLLEMRPHVTPAQQAQIDDYIPPQNISLLKAADLPQQARAPFTERDGTLGRLIFIEQAGKDSNWDGRYLVAWSHDVRAVATQSGIKPPLAGRPPIFADMLDAIWTDGPHAIAASLAATSILLLLAFNTWRRRLLTLFALLLGILWMGATMAVAGIKLNFLNFVAFPITFGNGVDYGVNVMRRYAAEANRGTERLVAIRYAVEETGGAVVLCSLTTVIGYMSLHASSNLAIASFGTVMAISEITCLLASVLTMPAVMLLWRRYVLRRSPPPTAGPASGAPLRRDLTIPGILTPRRSRRGPNDSK